MMQYHEAKQWIPDTTYFITFNKVVDKDIIYREISVSKKDFNSYFIGDSIKLKD